MSNHVENFGDAAESYENAGELQNYVAARLAEQIFDAKINASSVLEIGCGTGFLTRHLHQIFGTSAQYLITDLSDKMVSHCRDAFTEAANMNFEIMDGQKITTPWQSADLISSNMAIQWFEDPAQSLEDMRKHLKPGGEIHYATIGADNFTEWREHLEAWELDFGMRPQPETLPGALREEFIPREYGSGWNFMRMLKDTGANTPKPGYVAPSLKDFSKAYKSFHGEVTWHIVYGSLTNG